MSNESRGEECEWSEHDKQNYCEHIGVCPKEDPSTKQVFNQTCYKIENTIGEGINKCSPIHFRCDRMQPAFVDESELIDSEKNSTDEEFFKCYCSEFTMVISEVRRNYIDCRCDGYDLTNKEDKKINKTDTKYTRVDARTCRQRTKRKGENKPRYTCLLNKGCFSSSFDSDFQCNTNLYLPNLNSQNNYSHPLVNTDQQICHGLGLQRFAGQISFLLLYIPFIFLISYILHHCLELRRTKLTIDIPKCKVPETLKKHINKVKELCKKKKEQQKDTVEKI